jgi:cytochrome c oxidase subunit 3
MSQVAIHKDSPLRNKIHPQSFALYASFASIFMMFAAFTSAYIVRQSSGDWLDFAVPTLFYFSTAALLISSFTIHYSYNSFKNNKEQSYKIFLLISLVLGILFVVLQYNGWSQMFAQGIDMKRNLSGAFFYLITGAHAAHILGGVSAIIVAIIHAYTLPFKVTEKRRHRFSLVVQYWHFVDVLWIYLLVFLLFSR